MTERPAKHEPITIGGDTSAPSPFRPGERPLFIGGRIAERTAIRSWFDRQVRGSHSTSLLLYGPRGTGKTTLSGYLVEQAASVGLLPLMLRGDRDSTFATQVAELSTHPAGDIHWKVGVDLGLVQASVERAMQSAPPTPSLPDLIVRVLDEVDNGILVIVDEAQAADESELAALVAVLEDLADVRRLPVAVAVLGTEKLLDAIGPSGGSLGRLHRSAHVELPVRQTFEETLDICAGTLVEHPGISEEAVEVIHRNSGGFPHAVQLFGEVAFARADGEVIESGHVVAAHDDVFARLERQVFQMMWRRQGARGPTPHRTHEYLRHVAAGERSHARIAELVGIEPTSLSHIRHELIVRGVLVSVDGALEFGIPMMQDFVVDR